MFAVPSKMVKTQICVAAMHHIFIAKSTMVEVGIITNRDDVIPAFDISHYKKNICLVCVMGLAMIFDENILSHLFYGSIIPVF